MSTRLNETSISAGGRRERLGVLLALSLIFCALVGPPTCAQRGGPSEAYDQATYHLPVIVQLMREWPDVDLVNYRSVTGPGFHLTMAALGRLAGWERGSLGLGLMHGAAAGFGLLSILGTYWSGRRFARPWIAGLAALPLLFNSYLLGASIYLTTDTMAVMFVIGAIGLGPLGKARTTELLSSGALAALAVSVRQIHMWVVGPVLAAGALASPLVALGPAWAQVFAGDGRRSWSRLWIAALSAAPAVIAVGVMVWAWGGLTPPHYRAKHASGFNFAGVLVMLSLLALIAPGTLLSAWRHDRADRRWCVGVMCAIAGALALWILIPSAFESPARSRGWLWMIVERAPSVLDRSLVFLALAPLGAAAVWTLHRRAERLGRARQSTGLLVSLVAITVAQSANSMAWVRYHEPMALAFIALFATLATPREGRADRWIIASLLALAGLHAAISYLSLYCDVYPWLPCP